MLVIEWIIHLPSPRSSWKSLCLPAQLATLPSRYAHLCWRRAGQTAQPKVSLSLGLDQLRCGPDRGPGGTRSTRTPCLVPRSQLTGFKGIDEAEQEITREPGFNNAQVTLQNFFWYWKQRTANLLAERFDWLFGAGCLWEHKRTWLVVTLHYYMVSVPYIINIIFWQSKKEDSWKRTGLNVNFQQNNGNLIGITYRQWQADCHLIHSSSKGRKVVCDLLLMSMAGTGHFNREGISRLDNRSPIQSNRSASIHDPTPEQQNIQRYRFPCRFLVFLQNVWTSQTERTARPAASRFRQWQRPRRLLTCWRGSGCWPPSLEGARGVGVVLLFFFFSCACQKSHFTLWRSVAALHRSRAVWSFHVLLSNPRKRRLNGFKVVV